jgi:hypothetical protein
LGGFPESTPLFLIIWVRAAIDMALELTVIILPLPDKMK